MWPYNVNVTAHPTATWVWRQLINATPWGNSPRFLIRDRDRSYGGDFIERAKRIGIHTVLTPIATPQANGIAERLVGTFRRECLDLWSHNIGRRFGSPYLACCFGPGTQREFRRDPIMQAHSQRRLTLSSTSVEAGTPTPEITR